MNGNCKLFKTDVDLSSLDNYTYIHLSMTNCVTEVRQTEVWKYPHGLSDLPHVTEQLWPGSPAELWNYGSLHQNCESKPGGGALEQAYDLKQKQMVRRPDNQQCLTSSKMADCITSLISPWKNCPLRFLAAALDRANHTTVSAPWSTLRNLFPIIWWNWGIDVETAANNKHCTK